MAKKSTFHIFGGDEVYAAYRGIFDWFDGTERVYSLEDFRAKVCGETKMCAVNAITGWAVLRQNNETMCVRSIHQFLDHIIFDSEDLSYNIAMEGLRWFTADGIGGRRATQNGGYGRPYIDKDETAEAFHVMELSDSLPESYDTHRAEIDALLENFDISGNGSDVIETYHDLGGLPHKETQTKSLHSYREWYNRWRRDRLLGDINDVATIKIALMDLGINMAKNARNKFASDWNVRVDAKTFVITDILTKAWIFDAAQEGFLWGNYNQPTSPGDAKHNMQKALGFLHKGLADGAERLLIRSKAMRSPRISCYMPPLNTIFPPDRRGNYYDDMSNKEHSYYYRARAREGWESAFHEYINIPLDREQLKATDHLILSEIEFFCMITPFFVLLPNGRDEMGRPTYPHSNSTKIIMPENAENFWLNCPAGFHRAEMSEVDKLRARAGWDK